MIGLAMVMIWRRILRHVVDRCADLKREVLMLSLRLKPFEDDSPARHGQRRSRGRERRLLEMLRGEFGRGLLPSIV
jgi:hypothetical protein